MDDKIKKEADKKILSKVKFAKNGRYIFLRLALGVPHEAIGILEDIKVDILGIARMPRVLEQQKQAARRAALRGGDIKASAKQDKNFFKKTFEK